MEAIGNAITDAITATLQTGMVGKIPGFPLHRVKWHIAEDIPQASECPAIGVHISNDWRKVEETLRGRDSSGNVVDGTEYRIYNGKIRIWQKGRKQDELVNELTQIADVITGILTDLILLSGTKAFVNVSGGQATVAVPSGGALLAACEIELEIHSFNVQGESTYSGMS